MAIYRVLQPLSKGKDTIHQGDFVLSTEFSLASLAKLEEVGAIGLLHAPPLSELPDFDPAEKLAAIGIINADQLLEKSIDEITTSLNSAGFSDDVAAVRQWRAEVSDWLIIPVRPSSG